MNVFARHPVLVKMVWYTAYTMVRHSTGLSLVDVMIPLFTGKEYSLICFTSPQHVIQHEILLYYNNLLSPLI